MKFRKLQLVAKGTHVSSRKSPSRKSGNDSFAPSSPRTMMAIIWMMVSGIITTKNIIKIANNTFTPNSQDFNTCYLSLTFPFELHPASPPDSFMPRCISPDTPTRVSSALCSYQFAALKECLLLSPSGATPRLCYYNDSAGQP